MTDLEPRVPGPFRIDDQSPVKFAAAKLEWARVGYFQLAEVARSRGPEIVYQESADAMQRETGIGTLTPMRNWIGKPLALIAEMCVENGEPQLTSLVVSQASGEVGPSYAYTFTLAGLDVPADLQKAAAQDRQRCYEHYAEHPPVGWEATKLKGKRVPRMTRQPTPPPPEPKPPALCLACNTVLPANGECYYCE